MLRNSQSIDFVGREFNETKRVLHTNEIDARR